MKSLDKAALKSLFTTTTTALVLASGAFLAAPAVAAPPTKIYTSPKRIDTVPEKIRILPDVPVEIDIWTDRGEGARYCVGDPIEIYFRTNVDAYVAIYDTDTRGRTHRLFPNRWDRDNFVEGGRVYRLPANGYDFEVEGPPGRETLHAVAALDRRDLRNAGKLPAAYAPARGEKPGYSRIKHRAEKIAIVPHDVAFDAISHRVRDHHRCRHRAPRPWWRR